MRLLFFHKQDCPNCKVEEAKLKTAKLPPSVKVVYYDIETVDGLALAVYSDVHTVPMFLLLDQDGEIARSDRIDDILDRLGAER